MINLTERRVRVVVCDDDETDLSAVEVTLFIARRVIDVVGTARSAGELLDLAGHTDFDVAVIDLHMPGVDGLETARRLKAAVPGCKVVIFSAHEERREEVEAEPAVDLFLYKVELASLDVRIVELVGEPVPAQKGIIGRVREALRSAS
jgi:DNA-binding NarL/FixJ family response regulator